MTYNKPEINSDSEKLSVGIVLLPNFTLLAVSCFLDVLRHAADEGDESRQINCSWHLLSTSLNPVTSSSGVALVPDRTLETDISSYDYIVIAGGKLHKNYEYSAAYIEFILYCYHQNKRIIGLCTGTFALARAGIMKNVRAALHWFHYHEYMQHFESVTPVPDQLFLEDRGIITCVGGAASSDLALHLVERHLGKGYVVKCLRHLILISARNARQSQTPFDQDIPRYTDLRMRKAVFLMEQHLDKPLEITDIADKLLLSPRQLSRLFLHYAEISPAKYYRNLRLRHAHWLLKNTDQSLEQVALSCGFSDLPHMTRFYKKIYSATPGQTKKSYKEHKQLSQST